VIITQSKLSKAMERMNVRTERVIRELLK